MFHETEAPVVGHRNQGPGRGGGQQNLDKSERRQDPGQHTRILYRPECWRSEEVRIVHLFGQLAATHAPLLISAAVWKDLINNSPFLCRAWFFCKACHDDIKDETLIKKCKCKNCKCNRYPPSPSLLRSPYFSDRAQQRTELPWLPRGSCKHS